MIGTARALVGQHYYGREIPSERVFAELRGYINRLEYYNGTSLKELQKTDPGRKYIRDLVDKQNELQNNHEEDNMHYVAIDGRSISSKYILTINVPMGVDQIVLASDGYLELKDTLDKTEKRHQAIIQKDPLLIFDYRNVKGVKNNELSFDDRAYVRFEIKE